MRTPQNPAFQCAVCLAEFDNTDDALHLLSKCGHVFHAHCIDAWLSSVLSKKIEHRKKGKKIVE
ncbi:E3 ubiquitin-protein ligase ATL6 [Glycine max]|nr:E3 ubiquitin-protein ligase ATL6 [Glycine max]